MNKIGVVGSRTFQDYKQLNEILYKFLPFILVSGGAKGADQLAEQFANKYNLTKIIHLSNWKKYGKTAGFIRNNLIIKDSEMLIAFWDGKSKGTKHSIDKARCKNIPIMIIDAVSKGELKNGKQ